MILKYVIGDMQTPLFCKATGVPVGTYSSLLLWLLRPSLKLNPRVSQLSDARLDKGGKRLYSNVPDQQRAGKAALGLHLESA